MNRSSSNSQDQMLLPISGCCVQHKDDESKKMGVVTKSPAIADTNCVLVKWLEENRSTRENPDNLKSGFRYGMPVEDIPLSNTRRTLGIGTVLSVRSIAGRNQILVQFDNDGRSLWLPYENLRRVKDAKARYLRSEIGEPNHATRFRLKLLANALENWNQLTGSLDRLPVDPLPHQIQLVYRILQSGNYNWIIGDDVGLGKTIEMGLVLAGLTRKGFARRVLIICPAGLQLQWQQELRYKFNQEYKIYGTDFSEGAFDSFRSVIVSIDRAKHENHMGLFVESEGWDVIVFDEGHKLTRYESGHQSERYKLAAALRKKSDAFFLLSGTPHQGYTDRFVALLQLTRPDLERRLSNIHSDPQVVAEIILRNRKSDVTDANGEFIFKGLNVNRVPINASPQTEEFHRLLNEYLKRGYRAGSKKGYQAIGFVMTIYRKLASSSIAAIQLALERRKQRLAEEAESFEDKRLSDEEFEELVIGGDEQYDLGERDHPFAQLRFFDAEEQMIDELIEFARVVRKSDEKLNRFLELIVDIVIDERKKLLIFTEYRATQDYLKEALESRFPNLGSVLMINGSMSLQEKVATISKFNDVSNKENNFLVSTEAGGEGINLHESCHVMVNYDLPWNPARLLQRIGRLYRYGQQYSVIVLNLHTNDSFDNSSISLMMDRVNNIASSMATVGGEFNSRLYSDILGDILENLDLSKILQASTDMNIERTEEQIKSALENAQQAKKLQDDLLSAVTGYNPDALEGTIGFTMEHVHSFVVGMLPVLGIDIEDRTHRGLVLKCRLPLEFRGRFPEFSKHLVVRITADRSLAAKLSDVVLMDFENRFFQFLINEAKAHQFDGIYASTCSQKYPDGTLFAAKLRWQNDQGIPGSEEFVTAFCDHQNSIAVNPKFLADWLTEECNDFDGNPITNQEERKTKFESVKQVLDNRLQADSNLFKHPNSLVMLAAGEFCS